MSAAELRAAGFYAGDQDVTTRALMAVTERCAPHEHALGSSYHYLDPSGARLAVHESDSRIVCATPDFAGSSAVRLRLSGTLPDPAGCPFCGLIEAELIDAAGDVPYPLLAKSSAFAEEVPRMHWDELGEFSLTALALAVDLWESEGVFEASQAGQPGFAARSFVPSGSFGDQKSNTALINGVVRGCERRTNELTGLPFETAVLETYGCAVDVCLPAADGALELREGMVIGGSFSLMATRRAAGS